MVSRFAAPVSPDDRGQFIIENNRDGYIDIYYELSPNRLVGSEITPASSRRLLLTLCPSEDRITIFPVNTLPDHSDFLNQKYLLVESIALEGFPFEEPSTADDIYGLLESFPSGFVKDPEYGLGLLKEYRFIIIGIEENPYLRHLVVSWDRASAIEGDTHYMAAGDFEAVRRALNNTHADILAKGRVDKQILAHNALMTAIDPVEYPEKHRPYVRDIIFKAVTGQGGSIPTLSDSDGLSVIRLVSKNKRELSRRHPESLLALQRDIEVVTLQETIDKIEGLIGKRVTENYWQDFFAANPFVLSLAFGLPLLAIGGQLAVGGMKITGTGEKYPDFLRKNNFTDNLTVIEVKPARAAVLGKEYRRGVYPPSKELSGAISQVLDQRYQLQKSLVGIKDKSRRYDLESFAVRCIVIIGLMPASFDEKKSFEMFRNSLDGVLIVTFDELLQKLKDLCDFLNSDL